MFAFYINLPGWCSCWSRPASWSRFSCASVLQWSTLSTTLEKECGEKKYGSSYLKIMCCPIPPIDEDLAPLVEWILSVAIILRLCDINSMRVRMPPRMFFFLWAEKIQSFDIIKTEQFPVSKYIFVLTKVTRGRGTGHIFVKHGPCATILWPISNMVDERIHWTNREERMKDMLSSTIVLGDNHDKGYEL